MNNAVDFKETLSIKVGKFLISKGFSLASSTGVASHGCDVRGIFIDTEAVGILYEDPAKVYKLFGFIPVSRWILLSMMAIGYIPSSSRRIFIGTIWFSNIFRGADKKNWFFETYGREYAGLTKRLAEEMTETFNVRINICLVHEQPDYEAYLDDFGI